MSKLAKVFVTIIVVLLFIVIFAAISGIRSETGHHTPGIFGLVVFAALIGALRAIWKKSTKNDENENNSMLQK